MWRKTTELPSTNDKNKPSLHNDQPRSLTRPHVGASSVPWWAAVTCNILAAVALVLLAMDPNGNLLVAATIIVVSAVAFYGTAVVLWLRKR
jgi:predicted lysophospholipase L1 biosynthesis ABC-type transport system permease subunit